MGDSDWQNESCRFIGSRVEWDFVQKKKKKKVVWEKKNKLLYSHFNSIKSDLVFMQAKTYKNVL